jgi:hypothetical protein
VLFWLLWLPVSVTLEYRREDSDDEGLLSVRWLFGLVHIRRQLTHIDATIGGNGPAVVVRHKKASHPADAPSSGTHAAQADANVEAVSLKDILQFLRAWPRWMERIAQVWPVVKRLLGRVHVRRFRCHIRVGTGDVVTSGMSCGAAWGITSTVLGSMSTLCQFEQMPDIQIQPDFERRMLHTTLECILRVRAGYAIGAGLRFIRVWRRKQTNGSPDSRTHANGHDEHS